ncbi:MAG: PQQ-binding-like beta-propeller repeat protein [Candidatus Aminicenantes bacterium]|nr:PQQ-binding-like beta-propeller repeat protein [Candidatus Aminicenantes bacterium]
MRVHVVLLLSGLAWCAACQRPAPKLIPEISPPLVQEEIASWKGCVAGNTLFPVAGGVGWVDVTGRIMACDVAKRSVAEIFRASFAVEAAPFHQGDLLVLQGKSADRLLVYDLAAREVKFEAVHLGAQDILGIDADCLVYTEDGRLTVNFWRRAGVVFRSPAEAAPFLDCQFSAERILVLAPEFLHTFRKGSGRFERERLPLPAVSPFASSGDHIYYGSSGRFLAKYSTRKKRLAWKVKLGKLLERRPLVFAGTVVAGPEDNNVLLVNERGSILWWQALGSTLRFDLLRMREHLAAVLMNRDITFIDPKRRCLTVFPGAKRPSGPPLAYGGGLYFLASDGDACRLQRVANRCGIDIELEPAPVRWAGRSVRFSLRPVNLVEPSWTCVIRDAAGQQVFFKSMATAEKTSLAWVPPRAGKYVIEARARSRGRSDENKASLQVVDERSLAPSFYLHF